MDTLRGAFDSDIPADDSQDWGADASADRGAPEEEDVRQLPPEAIGQDERRMQVRAYNHWASLLGEATFPNIEDLEPENLGDFGPNSVLLDFSAGIDDPVVQFLGPKLGEECGAENGDAAGIEKLSDVPPRSLLSRITDHYMQILANQAPIGFEAEFVNQRGSAILYRGILLPFSSDDETIDFIYGVINWKEMADAATADELLLEIDQAIEGSDPDGEPAGEAESDDVSIEEDQPHKHNADPLTEWADSPAHEEEGALGVETGQEAEPLDIDALELDNVAAFGDTNAGETAGDDLPTPDFGNFSYDDEIYAEYGEEDEEEGEDEGSYSFASLSDYLEAPAKKAVDLDAEHFDPEDYKVEETAPDPAPGPAPDGVTAAEEIVAPEPVETDEPASGEVTQDESADDESADEAFDLGGHEIEDTFDSVEDPVLEIVEEAAPEPEPQAAVTELSAETDAAEDVAEEAEDEPAAETAAPAPELSETASLYDCLASARELAQSARVSEDRSRNALYAAVGRAYDVSLAAEQEPEAYNELIEDCGLAVQDRAPMTPIVKLVFGHDYDKTRLTEYAAVLSHAHRLQLERGSLAGYLADAEGGLKGVVQAERRLRREEAGKEVEAEGDVRAQLAKKLRELDEILLDALDGEGPEFSLVMLRRDADGKASLIGEIADDVSLIERAGKRLIG